MSYLRPITIADGANLDSFSRLRVSEPQALFDAQLTYDLSPLLYEAVTAEADATVTHDATNRCALMTFAATPTGGAAFMQTYEHMRYQPGKSMLAFVTFNFIEAVANTLKFAGYSDGVDGVEFQLDGTTKQISVHSSTTPGNAVVAQADWNLDKLDGTGPSGITLDITKTQIFVIDLQALYVGRVRVGFDIDGSIVYVHEYMHANVFTYPYVASANLPIRCGMTCTDTVTTTMNFICCSAISEGGQDEAFAYAFSVEGTVTAANGARTHVLSVRPNTTFNSITNRARFILDSIEILVTGNTPILWELVVGQAISGTTAFTDVNAAYSTFEYNTAGTISGSPAIVIASGYVAASATSKTVTSARFSNRYPITLDAAGAVRSLGTLSLIVTGLGATSAMRATFNWREAR